MEGAIVFAPAFVSLCAGLWRGRSFSRWCLASAALILLTIGLSVFVLPLSFATTARASLVALALMGGAGLIGPALFHSKAPAIVASFFAALLVAIPATYVAFYAAMSYACSRGPCY